VDPATEEVLAELVTLEKKLDKRIGALLSQHPAYPWFSKVKGIGKENIAKVIGPIDINVADTISSLWKFAGYHVVDEHAPKPEKGVKLEYNAQLRVMVWRLVGSLLKAKGKFYDYYLHEKEAISARCKQDGILIMPTPAGKVCVACAKVAAVVTAKYCPDCGGKLDTKSEPPGVMYAGHLHARAIRKTAKMFLSMLWVTWREAEGLPTRPPYVIDRLKHTKLYVPEEFTDK